MASLQSFLMPLTPVKPAGRRKKLSLSPVKLFTSPKPRTTSEQAPKKPMIEDASFYVPTAALNFREFSFWNQSENNYRGISGEHMDKLLDYMTEKYGVDDIQCSGPYLILRCDVIPPQDMRPFTIGGCLAIWLTRTQPLPRELMLGCDGAAPKLQLGDMEAEDLKMYNIPRASTILSIWEKHFPDAEALTYVATGLLVELPQTDRAGFAARLKSLPERFANSAASLGYVNGPLVRHELGGRKQPQPEILDGQYDDSDYVESDKCFYPGSMVANSNGGMVSAGIALERSQNLRITVAFHCWADEYKGQKERLGDDNFLTVIQGKTVVGNVTDRISQTDIGLTTLKPQITFNNQFLGIDAVPKVLLPLGDVNYRDEFVIDGFTTSVQRLKCLGARWRKEKARTEELFKTNSLAELPGPSRYVIVQQGVMATGEPEMRGTPMIREGVCGSALLRVRTAAGEDVTSQGQIAAFMHWCDLQSVYNVEDPPPLLCYCDSVQELIESGWKVVQTGEKWKAED